MNSSSRLATPLFLLGLSTLAAVPSHPAYAGVPRQERGYEDRLPEELGSSLGDDDGGGSPGDGACPLTEINVNEFDWVGGLRLNPAELTDAGKNLSCLQTTIGEAVNRCKSEVDPGLWWRDLDDCAILGYFMHLPKVVALFNLEDVPLRPAQVEGAIAESDWYFRKHSCWGGVCHQGRLYFDDSCNTVENPTTEELSESCDGGSFNWATPISLVWEPGADIDGEIAFTKFQLDPARSGLWYTWKASSATPLLVYDPEHKGVIRSASQLFGNWAFGGKTTASLSNTVSSAALGTVPWKDGFEALETLDTDHNGSLQNDELQALGVWFDRNRDGVSQLGEVISAREAGVTRLAVHSDRVDSITKTVFATDGFERTSEHGVIRGALADWYGESALSEQELVGRQSMRSALCSEPQSAPSAVSKLLQPAIRPDSEDSLTGKRFETRSPFSGVWRWRITSDDENVLKDHFGIITFSGVGKDTMNGHILVEVPINQVGHGLSRMVQILPFTGKYGSDALGKASGQFTLPGIRTAQNADSSISLSEDGRTIRGESETNVVYKGRPVKFKYRWIADKIS